MIFEQQKTTFRVIVDVLNYCYYFGNLIDDSLTSPVIPACPESFFVFKKDSRPAYRTGRRALLAGMTTLKFSIAGVIIGLMED